MAAHQMDDSGTRLFHIHNTLMQMLKDRDYLVADMELDLTKDEFREKYGDDPKRDDLVIRKSRRSNNIDMIFVFFPEEAKVGVKTITRYVDLMEAQNVFRAILVVQQNLTPFCKQHISGLSKEYLLEVFQEAELLVNIKEHVLVPGHQILTEQEKETLLQRYAVKGTQLPRIQENDPICRYHGLQKGQVVKITRTGETAGQYVTYRFVV